MISICLIRVSHIYEISYVPIRKTISTDFIKCITTPTVDCVFVVHMRPYMKSIFPILFLFWLLARVHTQCTHVNTHKRIFPDRRIYVYDDENLIHMYKCHMYQMERERISEVDNPRVLSHIYNIHTKQSEIRNTPYMMW